MSSIVCIFAHPDDEAFGPAGTIAKLSKKNNVYLICATSGEAGKNYSQSNNLAVTRKSELLESAKILGIKKVFFLGFKDGTLSNNLYHSLAEEIIKILNKIKPDTLMTYEPQGVSGHIDHITISMVTSFVFRELPFVKTVLQVALLKKRAKTRKDYFIYFPEGYAESEINKTVDISDVWPLKIAAMRAHKSQIKDVERTIKRSEQFPKKEYFLVKRKTHNS